ncbi:NUDIX hydrolase [Amycolatopsis rubida]|uniref:NUDIX hydrolase n=1 Tax=Amycolatopsis rubida TaxID=112413 RepID=UPI000B8588F4|nr:NUDIX domain-containing protein [Amycolatopsis rubida]
MARTDYYQDPNAPEANSIVSAVTAFVLNGDGQLLMIRRTDNDLYAIPGGGQEIGESIADTVIREVREETGIKVTVDEVIGIYTDPQHVIEFTDGEVRQEFSICFRATPIGGQLRTSSESKEALWANPEELESLNISDSIRLRISHGFERRRKPYFTPAS